MVFGEVVQERRRHGGMGSSELKLKVTSRDSCNSAIAIATRDRS